MDRIDCMDLPGELWIQPISFSVWSKVIMQLLQSCPLQDQRYQSRVERFPCHAASRCSLETETGCKQGLSMAISHVVLHSVNFHHIEYDLVGTWSALEAFL